MPTAGSVFDQGHANSLMWDSGRDGILVQVPTAPTPQPSVSSVGSAGSSSSGESICIFSCSDHALEECRRRILQRNE